MVLLGCSPVGIRFHGFGGLLPYRDKVSRFSGLSQDLHQNRGL